LYLLKLVKVCYSSKKALFCRTTCW